MENLRSIFKNRSSRWSVTHKMFLSLFTTGVAIEFSLAGENFVDGLTISRFLGPTEMAAGGIAHPIFSILGIISGLLAIGMQLGCSQAIGRGNLKDFSRIVSTALFTGTVLSIILAALVLIFAEPIVMLLGASKNASNLSLDASRYVIGIGVGIPPLIITAILAPALQLDTGHKTVQIGAVIELITNIILDISLAKLGFGILGIGLATAIASYLNLIYQCSFFLRKDRTIHLVKPDYPIKDFIKLLLDGSEKAMKRFANTLRRIILNMVIISYGGTLAMSAFSVRNNFSDFAEILGAGIASAVALLTGVYYGEINEEGIEEVTSYGQKMVLLLSGSICLVMFFLARPIAGIYITTNDELLKMTTFAIRMLALQNPLQALIASRIKYLQATHNRRNMNLLIFAAQFVFVLISAFVLGKTFGVYGILACYTVSDFLSLLAIYIHYVIRKRRLILTKEDYLNLPEEFHVDPENVISLDIRNFNDVSLGSEQIMLFCKGHKIDSRTSYFAALSFEELAENIVENGFPYSKSINPMIDLRVIITENSVVMRMRDNCPKLDVTKQISATVADDADPIHNVGIRLVSMVATDIVYMPTFNTNSLIIRFDAAGSKLKALPKQRLKCD